MSEVARVILQLVLGVVVLIVVAVVFCLVGILSAKIAMDIYDWVSARWEWYRYQRHKRDEQFKMQKEDGSSS